MAIDRPRRRFDGYDAAALVAATALGLVMAREIHQQYTSTMFDGGRHNPDGLRLWRYVSVPLFAAWTLALVPLQFRGPGWRPRLLARRPGLVAGVAVAFQVIRAGAEQATWLILHHRKWGIRLQWFGIGNEFFNIPGQFVCVADSTGFAVAAAWFALGLGRWWRPEANWIDRAGRIAGVAWIGLGLISWITGLID